MTRADYLCLAIAYSNAFRRELQAHMRVAWRCRLTLCVRVLQSVMAAQRETTRELEAQLVAELTTGPRPEAQA